MNRYFRIVGWLLVLAIGIATIGPVGLRPSFAGAGMERFAAFAVLGLALGIGYGRNPWLALAIVMSSASFFEVLQLIAPGRHGQWADLGLKLAGGFSGTLVGVIASSGIRTLVRR